jgi:hypothetical protein
LGISLDAAEGEAVAVVDNVEWKCQLACPLRTQPTDAWRSSEYGGSVWRSSAGPSCSGPSIALSWPVVRRTGVRAVRRVRPGPHTLSRHIRRAPCLPPRVSRQHRPSRIQFPAGRLAPTSPPERPSSGGIQASSQLPGGRLFHA